MTELEKLQERNKQLEAATSSSSSMVAAPPPTTTPSVKEANNEIVNERLNVRINTSAEPPEAASSTSPSTLEGRMVDVEVNVRGESSQIDILIRLLEFLSKHQNLNLISMEANTLLAHSTSFNRITFRLRVEVCSFLT